MSTRDQYFDLYEKLKGSGLDAILRTQPLDDHHREALRIIARLPDPWTASTSEITEICKSCVSGSLELLFGVSSIGETACTLRNALREPPNRVAPHCRPKTLVPPSTNKH